MFICISTLYCIKMIFRGLTQRVTMSDSKQGNMYDLWMMDPKKGDDRQTFIKKNKKIFCNAGNRLSDGRQYVLQYDESVNRVRCGPLHDTPQEALEFVSTNVSFNWIDSSSS